MAWQVLNYAEPNFCKIFRDLDLVAVQFAGLSCGAPELVNHVLHKCVRLTSSRSETLPQKFHKVGVKSKAVSCGEVSVGPGLR